MVQHELKGCKITPLSNYLKSLGLFRVLSKKDPKVTALWKNDRLVVETEMDKETMLEFFLQEYSPTPLISPWSYNKYEKTGKQIQELINSNKDRFKPYADTMDSVKQIIEKFSSIHSIEEKFCKDHITKDTKPVFLRLCRNYLPDSVIPWLDAVFVLGVEKPSFAPLLGTGANAGNFDMAENFVKCLSKVLEQGIKTDNKPKEWLESTLFGNTVSLDNTSTMGHDPDGSGGPNSGMGFEGKALSNPWDYILMLEGTMLFAGNLSKHLSVSSKEKAAFPFTASTSNIGYPTASPDVNESDTPSGGELWLPIWENMASYNEIKQIFNEGRIQLKGKQAKTGTEFSRAVITLGTDRGISQFQRFCILERKGQSNLAVNAGKMRVKYNPAATLLDELDTWFKPITDKSKEKGAPASMIRLVRGFDESIMKFCTYGKKQNLIQVLIMAGKLERYVSDRDGFKPLHQLSDRWIDECYDGSPEFRLAASIASIEPTNNKIHIRENLENITVKGSVWEHRKDSTSCVWKQDDSTTRNMARVLHRRGLDGKIHSLDSIPIWGHIHAWKGDIDKFLNGKLDLKKIGDLVLPLSIIGIKSDTDYPWKNIRDKDDSVVLPEAFAIIKLVHPPQKLEGIPFDTAILNMLHAKRLDDAYAKASYMLHSHGRTPLRYSKKSGNAKQANVSETVKKHLASALLFPISSQVRDSMIKTVIIVKQNTG